MPLFNCTNCSVVENTALSGFWRERSAAYEEKRPVTPLCSECDPAIGKWHNRFSRQFDEVPSDDRRVLGLEPRP